MALSAPLPFEALLFADDGVPTTTSVAQKLVEDDVALAYDEPRRRADFRQHLIINYKNHCRFLHRGLTKLGPGYTSLDASRPWLCYWISHGIELLNDELSVDEKKMLINTISRCQVETGGFGGGPQQLPHLAPTYASINTLAIVGTDDAYNCIHRGALYGFIKRLKQKDGSFIMHEGGEVDIRGAYCAVSCAVLCNLPVDELFEGTAEWIASCQTFEGGLAGVPGCEAHGGYTFCGLAALCLLARDDVVDIERLLHWAVHQQMRFEGGFRGRTNKLVDGCYSFWQGGLFPLIQHILARRGQEDLLPPDDFLYDRGALQEYILLVAQDAFGGFIDKPGKSRDYYHTCYVLSGLSSAQHYMNLTDEHPKAALFVGNIENLLRPTDPLHNVCSDKVHRMKRYFTALFP